MSPKLTTAITQAPPAPVASGDQRASVDNLNSTLSEVGEELDQAQRYADGLLDCQVTDAIAPLIRAVENLRDVTAALVERSTK